MRILTVMPSYWPAFEFGGPIYCIHDLNKALVKKGIDVSVYTTNAGLKDKVKHNTPVDVDGVKVTYFELNKFFDALGQSGWQFSMPLTKALRTNIKSFDLVYIVYVWNYTVAAASYFARKNNVPYIISPIGTLYSETRSHKSWKKLPYYKLISQRDLKNASAIHYTTLDEVEKCHKELKLTNKALVIPNGIELEDFTELPNKRELYSRYPYLEGKKTILFLGRLSWKKGIDLLISAFAELKKKRNDIHLLIVGSDEEGCAPKLKELISNLGLKFIDLGLKDNLKGNVTDENDKCLSITFTGMLTGQKKLEAFTGSDIFVLSSHSENFGMAVIESMAAKTPVIISDNVGIFRELKSNNSGLVIENNVEQLTLAINSLLDDNNKRKELADTGRKFVFDFYNISNVADNMINAFKETIDNKN